MLTGCGQRELRQNKTYPAEGKITLHGEPASFVMVLLEPADPSAGLSEARGVTDEQGVFTLRTYSNDEPDGAIAGQYTVTLQEFDPVEAVGAAPTQAVKKMTKIPGGSLKTEQTVEITSGDNNLEIVIP